MHNPTHIVQMIKSEKVSIKNLKVMVEGNPLCEYIKTPVCRVECGIAVLVILGSDWCVRNTVVWKRCAA